MKRAIIITSIVLVVAGGATTSALVLNQPTKETSQVTISKPVEQPKKQEPIVEPAVQEEVPQNASEPVVESVPTIEELTLTYEWNRMAAGTLENFLARWSQYFTEPERQSAFQYMQDTGKALCLKRNLPTNNVSSNWCFTNFMQHPIGESGIDDWVKIGIYTGVDISRYE